MNRGAASSHGNRRRPGSVTRPGGPATRPTVAQVAILQENQIRKHPQLNRSKTASALGHRNRSAGIEASTVVNGSTARNRWRHSIAVAGGAPASRRFGKYRIRVLNRQQSKTNFWLNGGHVGSVA